MKKSRNKFKIGDIITNVNPPEKSYFSLDLPQYSIGTIVGTDEDGDWIVRFEGFEKDQFFNEKYNLKEVKLHIISDSPLVRALK